jgi:serine protease Do
MYLSARARTFAILAATGAFVLPAACSEKPQEDATAQAHSAPVTRDASAAIAAAHGLPDFTALVDRYGDAVVNVRVVGRGEADPDADSLLDFFHRFMPGQEGAPEAGGSSGSQPPMLHGSGSGFIVSQDGIILTNAHVVSGADEVTVKLTDRREFSARVIGTDERTDVAVIKIEAKNLPVVAIGDDKHLKTGEWVLAIGSPFGLENTATAGIVSGTARTLGSDSYVPFIQTDVAVNPGNSGGPLFNLAGEVIGINSMIFSQNGGFMGISFAIPIDVAMDVRDQLVRTGHVVRGRIGVVVQNVDAPLASSFKLDRPRGALVSAVEDNGPADKGGLKPGDVILDVASTPIEQSNQLSGVVANITPGKTTEFTVWRDGSERKLDVKVGKLEENATPGVSAKPAHDEVEGSKLGLFVRPLTAAEKQRADTDGEVVVADVSGAAARAGLQPGDVILAVNSRDVKSVKDLREVARKLKAGESAALLVQRGQSQLFVPVRAG